MSELMFPLMKIVDKKPIAKKKVKKLKGCELLRVPNDEEGRAFLKTLSKYFNYSKHSMKKRGRGTQRKQKVATIGKTLNFCHDIPVGLSEWVAVYITPKYRSRY